MAPTRPPEVVACTECSPGHRCDSHRAPLAVGYQGARLQCPACGEEQNAPNMPRVTGCRVTCPRYGRREPGLPRAPFRPKLDPRSAKPDTDLVWKRARALEALERACDAWEQHRSAAASGHASPLSIQISEAFIEDAVRRLRALRKDDR